jgi:sporulation protein YlmC with PRC-barrel domain
VRIQLSQQLLDRQIVDRDGRLVGKVDDVEFAVDADGVPYVQTLLTGQRALGQRVGGRLGRLLVSLADRFVDDPPVPPLRIPFSLVHRVDSAVRLTAATGDLPPAPMEEWLRRHLIERIPGAGRASG